MSQPIDVENAYIVSNFLQYFAQIGKKATPEKGETRMKNENSIMVRVSSSLGAIIFRLHPAH